MKIELLINGTDVCQTHVPKSVDITFKIRDGKVIKVVKSIAESP